MNNAAKEQIRKKFEESFRRRHGSTIYCESEYRGWVAAYDEIALSFAQDINALKEQIKQLELAEDGAKDAFEHIVEEKQHFQKECARLQALLDSAYRDLKPFLSNLQADQ